MHLLMWVDMKFPVLKESYLYTLSSQWRTTKSTEIKISGFFVNKFGNVRKLLYLCIKKKT